MTTQPRQRSTKKIQAVKTGTTIHIEAPKSGQHSKHNPSIFIVHDVNPVGGFVDFLREHAVVGLAIGFIIGIQAQSLVKLLVTNFIDQAFLLLFGKSLSQRTFTLTFHGRSVPFGWGGFVYGLLNFLFVLAAIYAIVKLLKLDKLDKPLKDEAEELEEE